MDLNLNSRTVLITGGSRGMGEAIAHVLAQEGCSITIAATDAEKLKQMADHQSREYQGGITLLTVMQADDRPIGGATREWSGARP